MGVSNIFRKCIVFIDDDIELLMFFKECLKTAKYELYCYTSGDEAQKKIPEVCPAIIFIDYQMQEANGLVLMKKLKDLVPDSILIMLTGEGNERVAVSAMKGGADDYIIKPVSYSQIVEVIEDNLVKYFSSIINLNDKYDYPLNDASIARYEFLRAAYSGNFKSIKVLCKYFKYSRQDFYNYEKKFKLYGPIGLLKKRGFEKLPKPEIYKKDPNKKINSLNDFIDKNDEVQMKLEMFRETATTDKPNICEISKKYGFTREAFYQIYRRFKQDGLFALTEKKKGRPKKSS